MLATECGHCGARLRIAGVGRPQRYCSTRCRVAAYRARTTVVVPAELRRRDRWVRRSAAKVPLQVHCPRPASSTDPRTWASYQDAVRSPHGIGLGFVLNGDGIVCVDLDHCLEDGRLAAWAADLLDRCPETFVEVSPSGTGLHIWGYGEVGTGRVIRDGGVAVEVYGQGRYIAVTGRRWQRARLRLADLRPLLAELVTI